MNDCETLASLHNGETGAVTALICVGGMRRRLQDIGLIPGTRVTCLLRSPGGDPCAYAVRGALIALRKDNAKDILIQRLS